MRIERNLIIENFPIRLHKIISISINFSIFSNCILEQHKILGATNFVLKSAKIFIMSTQGENANEF